MQEIGILLTGSMLGLAHAFDADHIAAISAIVASERNPLKAMKVGALWGLGHSTSILAAGFLVLAAKVAIPARVSDLFEAAVGAALVFLGARVLRLRNRSAEDSPLHTHFFDRRRGAVSFFVGVLHGLAGSGAITLLILTTISSPRIGGLYLLIFSLGATASMTVLSWLMARPLAMWTSPAHRYGRWCQAAIGAYGIVLGGYMITAHGFLPLLAER